MPKKNRAALKCMGKILCFLGIFEILVEVLNFLLEVLNFVLKTRNFLLRLLNFTGKLPNFCQTEELRRENTELFVESAEP
ncbi:hypothetical protein AN964_21275 [Heyndrickxia shackletonii]|uniref:Uncharacterized protein n=1 Tax=Heyndrickxia shackletonii TaxID=157838 RepID=A0A0Q3WT50_9BACI|nr:hypothetical protein AN964_21275 [Heyndrickxia shackletonii]